MLRELLIHTLVKAGFAAELVVLFRIANAQSNSQRCANARHFRQGLADSRVRVST